MSKFQLNECKYCKRKFLTKYPTQKYCSKGCRIDAKNSREETSGQLCWRCENSCGRCSWSGNLIPVKGWKAEPSIVKYKGEELHTYKVIECPHFVFE